MKKVDQLLIDKMVLNDFKKSHTNLEMAWIGYKKAYDMIPCAWFLKSLELVQVPENVPFIRKSVKKLEYKVDIMWRISGKG